MSARWQPTARTATAVLALLAVAALVAAVASGWSRDVVTVDLATEVLVPGTPVAASPAAVAAVSELAADLDRLTAALTPLAPPDAAPTTTLAPTGSGPPGSAPSPEPAPPTEPDVAVVSTLLRFSRFGASAGMPLLCRAAVASMGQASTSAGTAAATAETLRGLSLLCGEMAAQGTAGVEATMDAAAGLTPLNELLDPALARGAESLLAAAAALGSSVAPFGPTIEDLAAVLEQFRSPP